MAPGMHDLDTCRNLTGNYLTVLSYHSVTTRQTREHSARFCLGESPEYKHFDLCYSFKTLVCVEYSSLQRLHEVAWNYRNNWAKLFGTSQDVRMSYDKALRNIIIFMFGYYINAFESYGARKGHQAILALECLTVTDELGRFHRWYKRVDLRKPGVMKTRWKELLQKPQDDCSNSYNLVLAALGSPKQPSYSHPKLLSRYFDHVYHMSWNIGQLTWKNQDKATDYNESVYNRELNELLSHLQGSGDLEYLTRETPGPTSLLNPEIILPEADFWAAHDKKKGWISEEWTCGDEVPSQYCHDQLQARLDWNGSPAELDREVDNIDKVNHEALYDDHLHDYPDEMPDLEDTDSINTSLYDRQAATLASTVISMDMEAAGGMLNLSMGLPELLATQQTSDPIDQTGKSLSDDDQFSDMFKVPAKVLAPWDPPPSLPWLDPQALMAEAKYKSGHRTLPPPPGLRRQDVVDTRNVVLRSIQTPKKTDTPVEVADPQNKDPLYLNWDASRDKALQTMQERHRRESRSSSMGSRSSSGKHHRSGSRSRDERGQRGVNKCPQRTGTHRAPWPELQDPL